MLLFTILGAAIVAYALWDAFETILLPRRVRFGPRLSRFSLRTQWRMWTAIARLISRRNRREDFLGVYALSSFIGLFALWAAVLVFGFALILTGLGSPLGMSHGGGNPGFLMDLYLSGSTLFTLGLGDVIPLSPAARIAIVVEAGTGLGYLALVLAYVPVLYQAFSRRESRVTMLDEWAGSPPSGAVILAQSFASRTPGNALDVLLREWEQGAAEILESHLSYPVLAFFRSQHDNQSWLSSIKAVLDACALVIAGSGGLDPFQARHTFAICRHMLVDVSQNIRRRPSPWNPDDPERLSQVFDWLERAGVPKARGPESIARLAELRANYMPFVEALSDLLLVPLPDFLPSDRARYNWETTDRSLASDHEPHTR